MESNGIRFKRREKTFNKSCNCVQLGGFKLLVKFQQTTTKLKMN